MATGGPHRGVSFFLVVGAALQVQLAAALAPPWEVCGISGNYTSNSTYQSNIKLLSATLPRNASTSSDLFAKASVGAAPDIVYALALCRGDVSASQCGTCVATAFNDAQQLCALNQHATVYYDECYLSFSGENFLDGFRNVGRTFILRNTAQVISSKVPAFDATVAALLNVTGEYAAANSSRRFATGEQDYDPRSYPTIYGLTQCTTDLSQDECRSCLRGLFGMMPKYLSGRPGGRMLRVRCNFRYEVYPFLSNAASLGPAPAPSPGPVNVTPTATPRGRSRKRIRMVLAIALPIISVVLAVTLVCLCLLRNRRRALPAHPQSFSTDPDDIECNGSLILNISTIRAATDNFAENNKLGEGGFSTVYKGILPDGQEIAVKRLSRSLRQGTQEMKNELVLVAKLQHKNLVRLIGVCLQEHEKLLVYEYMPNRSMDIILYDIEKSMQLDWRKRTKIINGIARGLQYLHEDSQLKIIHRDLKASNVLLDSDFTPKISGFGLARLLEGDQSQEVTKRVMGTHGYMAPEYAMRGHYSIKSDVYSFGILILEILTTKRRSGSFNFEQSIDFLSPVQVWEHWTAGTIVEMINSSLRGNAPMEQMLKCIHIGLLCVQDNPLDRPTMSTVNGMLSSSSVSLPAPLKPLCSESHPSDNQFPELPQALSANEVSIS